MSFSEKKRRLEDKSHQNSPSLDYYQTYLNTDTRNTLESLKGKFVYHLFNDLTEKKTEKNLEDFLESDYRHSDNYAKDCVEVALTKSELYGLRIKNWTDSALKCFDIFLLKLIQDVLGESIQPVYKLGTEREKYHHLSEKEGNLKEIGVAFDVIYEQRNKFTHVEVIEKDGRRRSRPISKKRIRKYKRIILDHFNKGLLALEEEIPSVEPKVS